MRKLIYILSALILFSCGAGSEEPKGPIFEVQGFALAGYDPVAYFEQSEAKKGSEEELVTYQENTYCFSSTKNRELFENNPEKYLPAYGGWCAYAVAEKSFKMQPDPEEWQIQDGELQLFTSTWMTKLTGSLIEDWNEDPEDFKKRADQNWEQMN